jgi:hypothetical protein
MTPLHSRPFFTSRPRPNVECVPRVRHHSYQDERTLVWRLDLIFLAYGFVGSTWLRLSSELTLSLLQVD